MLVETILFGKIEIPNCKEDIEKDILDRQKAKEDKNLKERK